MPRDEVQRIADQLARIHDGDPWYGPSTAEALRGVTAEQAAARPIPQAHSIWEIVLHMTAWEREILRRLQTGQVRDPEDGDWPRVPVHTEEAWRSTLARLQSNHRAVMEEVVQFPAERLDERLGGVRDPAQGSGVSYYVHLHGLVQHNIAHTAQISLLRKTFAPEE